jgi:hypothetical protein
MSKNNAVNVSSLPNKITPKTRARISKPLSSATLVTSYNQILKTTGSQKTLKTLPPPSVTLDPAHPIQGKSYLTVFNGNLTPLTIDDSGNIDSDGDILIVTNNQPISPNDGNTWDSYMSAIFETTPGNTYALEFAVSDDDTNGTWQFIGDVSATYPSQGISHSIIIGFKARNTKSGVYMFYQRKQDLSGSGIGIIYSVKLTQIE